MANYLTSLVDLDTAIRNNLEGCIVAGEAVPVVYVNPEEEYVSETYPCIVFYRAGMVSGKSRISIDPLKDNPVYNEEGTLVQCDVRNAPMPVDVLYVIRLFYNVQEDNSALNIHLLRRFPFPPNPCYVTVNGVKYDLLFDGQSVPRAMDKAFGEVDLSSEKEQRIFYEQYFFWCEVNVELDEREASPIAYKGTTFRIKAR